MKFSQDKIPQSPGIYWAIDNGRPEYRGDIHAVYVYNSRTRIELSCKFPWYSGPMSVNAKWVLWGDKIKTPIREIQ